MTVAAHAGDTPLYQKAPAWVEESALPDVQNKDRSAPAMLVFDLQEYIDGDGGHEDLDVAIEAGSDAPSVFDAAKHALDDIALAVDLPVMPDLDLAVGLGRDAGSDATLDQP